MNIDDFDEFFMEIHGYPPFPWQKRLLKMVIDSGWPEAINLPTASGKTSIIDIALFSMALGISQGKSHQMIPRRIFFTVDRRFVVDEAYETSILIKEALSKAVDVDNPGIVGETARNLRIFAGDGGMPVDVVRLRGGIPHERVFISNPLQPTIILSTVDQVGSRLLFRGYGVSEFMRPVHAALVGKDSLIIVDEAHLSPAFTDTLKMIQKYQDENWETIRIGKNAVVVSMTATPSVNGKATFSLEQDDWDNDILSKRFMASKPVINLINVKNSSEKTDHTAKEHNMKQFAEKFTTEAKSAMNKIKLVKNPVIGIVVNTVALANIIYDQLSHDENTDVVKIIGRIRPFERDAILEKFLPRMAAGHNDVTNPVPLFVVATQTVEVGANIDFNVLITEDASLDALRQRFGRLNRFGMNSESFGVIIHSSFREESNEFIYGKLWKETWKWLEKMKKEKRLDFGVKAMEILLQETDVSKLLAPKLVAPLLMPSHMDMLVQTSPSPAVEPEVSSLLHGPRTSPADVQVIWRGDLPDILGQDDADRAMDIISLLPPTTYEAVAVPVWVLKNKLNKMSSDFSDIEGETLQVLQNKDKENMETPSVFLWLGQDNSRIISADEIRPGQTVILPSKYGGYDQYGWNPSSNSPVSDIANISALKTRGKKVIRIHPAFMASWFDATEDETISQCRSILSEALTEFNSGEDLHYLVNRLLEQMADLPGIRPSMADSLREWHNMKSKRAERIYPSPEAQGILLELRMRTPKELTDDDDSSSYTEQVTLDEHSKGVEKQSRYYAEKIGLPDELCDSIAKAGLLHDLGKSDPRFQSWLRGGTIGNGGGNMLLAKSSGSGVMDFRAIQNARKISGYPKGGRHECYSAAMARENPELISSEDNAELIIYLIGSHHGRGRAMMPPIVDKGMDTTFEFAGNRVEFHGTHGLERIDSGWSDIFWKLVRNYGYWGLSYLEMIVRLGDHRESAIEVGNGRIQ